MFKKYLNQRGFTLIELLVVILIIVILATAAIASYTTATKSARDAKRKNDIEATKQALILYRQENSTYPVGAGNAAAFTSLVTTLKGGNYLGADASSTLVDPGSTSYTYWSDGTSFRLVATMEGTRGNYTNSNCNTAGTAVYCALNP